MTESCMAVARDAQQLPGGRGSVAVPLRFVSSGLLCLSWLMLALVDVVMSLAPTGTAAAHGHCPECQRLSRQVLEERA